jgi:multicomponent Na+:H+ antiporter subunit A
MLIAVLSSFVMSLVFGLISTKKGTSWTALYAVFPLALFLFFLNQFIALDVTGARWFQFDWVPSLGVDFSFYLDGLSLLFLLLITGIGTLVFAYTSQYLHGDKKLSRFFAYLTLFMGAMIGLVSSDNLITLFVFWELTSISSFLLIGYKNTDPESRKSALIALAVTGLGGLFLLAFAVFAGVLFGSYSIQEILSGSGNFGFWPSTILMLLLFVTAFTKSAQFPFHFWLPGAMKAPTPVSTYLHSATMVKAGLYLLLRFNPMFDGMELWHTVLLTFGGVTMLYAAFQTLFNVDMKSILAYSTISALGVIVFLIGIGGKYALGAAIVFIMAHALYKATLFMLTGIVDHQTHSRNIVELGGLRKIMPLVMLIGLFAALSNAGVPLFMGFLAKDMIYEGTLHHPNLAVLLTGLAIVTNVLLIYAGFAVGLKPFVGVLPNEFEKTEKPNFALWWPPALTAFLGLLLGLLPFLARELFELASLSVGAKEVVALKIWHGFNLVLLLSLLTLLLGILLFVFWKPSTAKLSFIEGFYRVSPKNLFQKLFEKSAALALFWTRLAQNGFLRNYVLVVVLALIIAMSVHVFRRPGDYIENIIFTSLSVNEIVLAIILVGSALFTLFSKSRLAAIAGLGVLGYAVCFVFVFYSAPDLALTQFSIDTLTVILFVLVLYNLPPYLKLSNSVLRWRDIGVASVFGVLITLITLEAVAETSQRSSNLANYFNENAYTLAKGKNIVNVILVDFRGADTLIETAVLAIAAIGVFGLIKLRIK